MEYKIKRDYRGNIAAESIFKFEGGKWIVITSNKMCSGGLWSHAQVCEIEQDGVFHVRKFEMFGDFRKQVAMKPARCTEKNIRALHEEAIAQIEQIKAEASAFYAMKVAA